MSEEQEGGGGFEFEPLPYLRQVMYIAMRYNAEQYSQLDQILEVARRAAAYGQFGDALTVLQYAVGNLDCDVTWFTEVAPGVQVREMHVLRWDEVAEVAKKEGGGQPNPPLRAEKLYIVYTVMHDSVLGEDFDACAIYAYVQPVFAGETLVKAKRGYWYRWACPAYVHQLARRAAAVKKAASVSDSMYRPMAFEESAAARPPMRAYTEETPLALPSREELEKAAAALSEEEEEEGEGEEEAGEALLEEERAAELRREVDREIERVKRMIMEKFGVGRGSEAEEE